MCYLTPILVFLSPLCVSASGIGGLKFPAKCGITLSQKQVFDYIFDCSVFRKDVIKTIETTGFPKHSSKNRQEYVQIMRRLSSGIEDRLLGRDSTKTRETLNFYADSLRMVHVYQRIHKMLSNDALLVGLVKAWENDLRSTLHESRQINEIDRKRMLKAAEDMMKSAKVDGKTVGASLVEFAHLISLANELGGNPTYDLFREANDATAKSPGLARMSSAVRQAVTLTLIHQGDADQPSRLDFERNLKKVCE